MTNEILVIDDNPDIRRLISGILKDKGFVVREAANFDQAMLEINKKLPDVAIIDVKLDKGDNDGIELLVHLKRIDDDVPVIMISGHANVQMAVDSLKLGAFEFIQKPFSSERLVNFANRAAENINLKKEKRVLENKLFNSYEIIGQSQTIEEIRNLIVKLSGTESRVFISGPAGSGKELVARQIHKQSSRSRKPFVVVNGALLAPNKYELELFGSESKNETINYGFFEKAKDGTLLIDEISEIPLETQAKILRVLIDQKFRRVNGFKEINDNYGHHVGDEILKHTATQLSSILRETDTVARLGGDEFAVLLPETSPSQAQRVIKSIVETIKQPLIHNGQSLSVSASIGMAACPQDATSADELLNAADKRMYDVKSTER